MYPPNLKSVALPFPEIIGGAQKIKCIVLSVLFVEERPTKTCSPRFPWVSSSFPARIGTVSPTLLRYFFMLCVQAPTLYLIDPFGVQCVLTNHPAGSRLRSHQPPRSMLSSLTVTIKVITAPHVFRTQGVLDTLKWKLPAFKERSQVK